jgi:hypothetical protein
MIYQINHIIIIGIADLGNGRSVNSQPTSDPSKHEAKNK